MVTLLPRLPGPAADNLLRSFLENEPAAWTGFDPDNLPEAVHYAPTGGSKADRNDLLSLRKTVEEAARAHGFGAPGSRAYSARFDAELSASLAKMPLLSSGETLRDDFWTFVGVTLAPDVVHWRFGAARARYLGGIRNTFQRLWLRAQALDRGGRHPRRWQLLEALTEDALVQITERPSIGADSVLARAVAEAWLRARKHHGKGAMEPIMRQAVLRVRVWNEIRSLADLPTDALASVLDGAFGLPGEGRSAEAGKLRRWEELVRHTGQGRMRYNAFRANVAVNATDAISGEILDQDGWEIGTVTADTAAEFKREMKEKVDAYLWHLQQGTD